MSYENAPATKMVATHCCCCGKALVDAKSVEAGMGPVCRKVHGYTLIDELVSEEDRAKANKLVHAIAADQGNAELVVANCQELFAMELTQLVAAILKRCASIKIVGLDNGRFAVQTPYNEKAIAQLKTIKGRWWDKDSKVNTFPMEKKKDVYAVLRRFWGGEAGIGPKGPFVVEPLLKVVK